jgi:hypothetical protein
MVQLLYDIRRQHECGAHSTPFTFGGQAGKVVNEVLFLYVASEFKADQ